MDRKELLAVALVVLATVGAITFIFGAERYRRGSSFTAELVARAPEKGGWQPRTLSVPYGEHVRLYIRNADTVSHGFALPDFNVAVKEIKAGHVEVVEFVADRNGTFPFMCTVWCSARHLEMTGAITVERGR